MNVDAKVLCATYGLARHQKTVSESEIAERLGMSLTAVRASMHRLEDAGLAEMRPVSAQRLTLLGLAIAVALASPQTPRGRSWARRVEARAA